MKNGSNLTEGVTYSIEGEAVIVIVVEVAVKVAGVVDFEANASDIIGDKGDI